MNHTHFVQSIPDTLGRYDMYANIHKALRKAQCEMLIRLGQTDFAHDDLAPLLEDLRDLLSFGSSHISHEEVHIHPAIELRSPAATTDLQRQHDSHRHNFRLLEELINVLQESAPEKREALGRRLYLAYSAFIAHDFEHMFEEETLNNARLWELFDDGELHAMERAIVGSLPPQKAMAAMRLMIPAISRDERVRLLAGMKENAPKEIFEAVMEHAARPTLCREDFSNLSRRLMLTQCVPVY